MRIRKGIDRREFWCCLRTCVAKATTVEDQLVIEAVRGEDNDAPKVVATIRELEKRLRLSQPYTWMLYMRYLK